jgi:hypothetical protein
VRTLIAVSGAGLVLVPAAMAGLAAGAPYPNALIGQATKMVRAKAGFSKAVLLEADGTPKAGTKVKTAMGIVNWRFVYNNQLSPGFTFRSAALYYKNGKFGRFAPNKSPFVEDRNISTVPKMTLATAIQKLRKAGHTGPFGAVTLRYPLGPGFTETLYIFTFGSGNDQTYWSVGTKTGKVKPLS